MYAVVNTGGKQYRVQNGQVFRVEKLPGEIGSPVTFDQVLLYSDGNELKVGQPLVEGVAVRGHIVEQDREKKIIVFKYKRRKRYRRKQGHRQYYTAIKVDGIGSPEELDQGESDQQPLAQKEAAPAQTPEPTAPSETEQGGEGDLAQKEEME